MATKVTKPLLTDETGQRLATAMETQNVILNTIAGANVAPVQDIKQFAAIVRGGKAPTTFKAGDLITVPWTDKATNVTYDAVFHIAHIGNVTIDSGESVPGVILQSHYAFPFGVQFNARNAFLAAVSSPIGKGTYHFTVATAYNNLAVGTYQFTLTEDIPVGGVAVFTTNYYDNGAVNAVFKTYPSRQSVTEIETVTVVSGSGGTDLGEFKAAGSTNLWSYHCACWGYNRWSKSALRQFLNSDAAPGAWWTPQTDYDRPPTELTTKHGFLSGFDDDFRSVLVPLPVATALNQITDDAVSETHLETTSDLVWLPSLVNMHINPQLAGEGDIWDYWLRASKQSALLAQYGTYPHMRTFAMENHLSPQYVRLRSAHRGYAGNTWHVYSSGSVGSPGTAAVYSSRFAPSVLIA